MIDFCGIIVLIPFDSIKTTNQLTQQATGRGDTMRAMFNDCEPNPLYQYTLNDIIEAAARCARALRDWAYSENCPPELNMQDWRIACWHTFKAAQQEEAFIYNQLSQENRIAFNQADISSRFRLSNKMGGNHASH